MPDIGYYTLPVLLSFRGIDKQVNDALGDALKPAAKKAGEDVAKGVAEGAKTGGKAAAESITKPVTEAAKKAGADAGKAIDAEVTKATKDTGTKVGKTINETVAKSTTGSGGLSKAAKDAAGEFGKGFIEGVTSELRKSGGIEDALGGIGDKVKGTTELVKGIGDAFGVNTDSIVSTSRTITGALDGVETAVGKAKTSFEAFQSGDLLGALPGAVDALRGLETIGLPPELGDNLQDIVNQATGLRSTFADTGDLLGTVLPGRAGSGAKSIIDSLGTIIPIANGVYEALDKITQDWHAGQQERFWTRWEADQRAREAGVKPPQPGVGDAGGPPRVGQGNAPSAPMMPSIREDMRAKIRSGQLPGYSLAPNGAIIGPDGKPVPGWSVGGVIPGFSATDDRLGMVAGGGVIGLAGGEGIIKASATRNLGGAPFINWLNGFSEGGVVPPDVAAATALVGTKYSKDARTDCSGMVARVINDALGTPGGGLMSTKTASEWLKARGFVPGSGGPGQISVGWYDHGPNPNDGHMAMTLSDGRNAESGGNSGPFTIGGPAAGASSPQFDQHMYLPTVYGEGPAGASAASSPFAGGGSAAAATAPPSSGTAPPSSAPASGGGGGSSFSLPSSLSGLATMGLDNLPNPTAGLPDTLPDGSKNPWKQDSAKKFGEAASAAVGGQIESALDVFGVPSSPGWLKGISTLVGGISVGGGSAAPLSASPSGMGTPPPDDPGNMHGSRAGQAPGPVTNIYAQDAEGALAKWQRLQDQRAAAKLDRF